jgi:hypothetical protein
MAAILVTHIFALSRIRAQTPFPFPLGQQNNGPRATYGPAARGGALDGFPGAEAPVTADPRRSVTVRKRELPPPVI